MRLFILLAVVGLSFFSCKKDSKKDDVVDYRTRDNELIEDYLKAKGIDAQKDSESGLFYVIKEEGSGISAEQKDTVVVNYIGYVIQRDEKTQEVSLVAKPFDFSPGAEPARRFLLSTLIEGWKIGIPKLKKGGSIDLYIPSHIAYGNRYQSNIPANSVLFFDISLQDVVIVKKKE